MLVKGEKMNEWKEEAAKRKDAKRFKDPVLDREPARGKKKKTKNVRVVAYPTLENKYVKEPRTAGWFATKEDAKKSIESKAQDIMSKYYTYKIVEE